VSIDYRLTPKHRCPAAYEDGVDVLQHLASMGSNPTMAAHIHSHSWAELAMAAHIHSHARPQAATISSTRRQEETDMRGQKDTQRRRSA
jgi:hypothetical protein